MVKSKNLFYSTIIIAAFLFFLVSFAQISKAQSVMDSGLEEELLEKTQIRVYVFIEDSINNLDSAKEQIVNTLNNSDFTLKTNLEGTDWFAGDLTKEGLEKLKAKPYILAIMILLNR